MVHDDRFPPEVEEALDEGGLDELLFQIQGPGIVLLDPTPVAPKPRPEAARGGRPQVRPVAASWWPTFAVVALALSVATAVSVVGGLAWWVL